MLNTQSISVKDARNQISQILEKVAIAKKSFIITKFGKPKAMVTPVPSEKLNKADEFEKVLRETAGIWKDRKDMANPTKWVEKIRTKNNSRYGKIFG